MSATEREHVMPPRPLMPWTMALCAGMCMSCALVLNVAADALLWERASAVGPLWAIPLRRRYSLCWLNLVRGLPLGSGGCMPRPSVLWRERSSRPGGLWAR